MDSHHGFTIMCVREDSFGQCVLTIWCRRYHEWLWVLSVIWDPYVPQVPWITWVPYVPRVREWHGTPSYVYFSSVSSLFLLQHHRLNAVLQNYFFPFNLHSICLFHLLSSVNNVTYVSSVLRKCIFKKGKYEDRHLMELVVLKLWNSNRLATGIK